MRPHRLTPTLITDAVPSLSLDSSSAASARMATTTTPPPSGEPTSIPPRPTFIPSHALFDLVIVGSGPSSLSLVARLLERRPAALYTEEEHAHLSWLHRRSSPPSTASSGVAHSNLVRTRKGGKKGNARFLVLETGAKETDRQGVVKEAPNGVAKILIVDKLGGWMRAWDNAFKAFDIRYLRSPLFWHPCPADRDGLLAFATLSGRSQVIEPSDFVAAMRRAPNVKGRGGAKGRRRAIGKGSGAAAATSFRRGSGESATSSSSSDSVSSDGGSTQSSATSCGSGCCDDVSSPPPLSAGLLEIAGCVGKEMSKHKKRVRAASRSNGATPTSLGIDVNERDRKDYHAAATDVFRDFIRSDVVKRYNLEGEGAWQSVGGAKDRWERQAEVDREISIEGCKTPFNKRNEASLCIDTVKSSVHSIAWTELELDDGAQGESFKGFAVHLDDGLVVGAKSLVVAVGPSGGRVNVPDVIRGRVSSSKKSDGDKAASLPSASPPTHGPGWAHTAALALPSFPFPVPPPPSSDKASTLVVIGGGLTSAQICDLGVRKGFKNVVLLLRGHMKVKPFDVGLEWLGRYSNLKKMQFWQEELASSRLDMIRSARQGGSITPVYAEILRSHVADGRLEILEHTAISEASYDVDAQEWSLELRRGDSSTAEGVRQEELKASYIVAATGAAPSILDLPLVVPINASHPIPIEGGLPLINEDLQWRADLPLFVVGGFSALQIGPGAGNLGGMQEAADRVALKLSELFTAASEAGCLSFSEVLPSYEGASNVVASSSDNDDGKARVPRHGRTSRRESGACKKRHEAPESGKERDVDSLKRAMESLPGLIGRRAQGQANEETVGEEDDDDEAEQPAEAFARSSFPHFGFHSLAVEG